MITAGGTGKRLPGDVKKQYRELNGQPILFHTINKFYSHRLINHIVVSLPEDDIESFESALYGRFSAEKITCCIGGNERQNSVYNALKSVPKITDNVLIHDGVRPFVTDKLISELISIADEKGAVIPVSKVKYTIKEVTGDLVKVTIPRETLREVHTPQVFPYKELMGFYLKAIETGTLFTDDASIYEIFDKPVHVLETEINNLKITNSLDLEVAKILINENKSEL